LDACWTRVGRVLDVPNMHQWSQAAPNAGGAAVGSSSEPADFSPDFSSDRASRLQPSQSQQTSAQTEPADFSPARASRLQPRQSQQTSAQTSTRRSQTLQHRQPDPTVLRSRRSRAKADCGQSGKIRESPLGRKRVGPTTPQAVGPTRSVSQGDCKMS
jgi:hypothetical protein